MKKFFMETGRRQFIKDSAIGVMGTIGGGYLLSSCNKSSKPKSIYEAPNFPEKAIDGNVIKAGLIGCGGRGTGAAVNFLNAGPNLQLTALADVFQDQIDKCRVTLKKSNNVEVRDERCY